VTNNENDFQEKEYRMEQSRGLCITRHQIPLEASLFKSNLIKIWKRTIIQI